MPSAYDQWVESTGVPIHHGYYIADARNVELSWWQDRGCSAAFLQLAGQEGVCETRVSEIPPGQTTPPLTFAMDEVVYVLEGRGLTTLWSDSSPKHTFEWQKHSMFILPRNHTYQLASTQGNTPARLLHYNYLPLAMMTVGEPGLFFNHVFAGAKDGRNGVLYSEAKEVRDAGDDLTTGIFWYGSFFPNMRAWDNLAPFRARGAGGHVVWVRFPQSPVTAHMSVFPARTYKKAHRHGPGFVIVIPSGEGYSQMWPEGKERILVPWQEGSVFVPPGRWFHQHFNLGAAPARYLALHPPQGLMGFSERIEDVQRDQIEYPDEDPWVRQRFEEELATRGLTSVMPEQA
ncbi:MAG: cupin domain-containing protein, partial [Chloroflexi bacterium]|nr:cupin domain-containing protein [Chloroflexota bacterium]